MGQFRLVHIGVAAALAAAAVTSVGLVQSVGAAGSGTASSFVPIVPCRLADTRGGALEGSRHTPLTAAETVTFAVWGTNGNCTIPNTATGIATNVTAVGPTADSYLTVFPADANPRPTASNLNVTSTSPPTPNQVTVALSAAGAVAVYNNGGSVNVIVDIVGYYIPAGGGTAGPPGPSGVTPRDVIWVAKSGGQFTLLSAAMNSITDTNPHLIMVAPGTYVETAPIAVKTNVDIEGSGQDRTTITCACALANTAGQDSTIYVSGAVSTEIRHITITNTGGPADLSYAVALFNATAATSIVDTTMTATNGPTATAMALYLLNPGLPHIDRINTYTTGAAFNAGVYVFNSGRVIVRNSWLYISGPGFSFSGYGQSRLVTSTINGATLNMSGKCDLVVDVFNNPATCA